MAIEVPFVSIEGGDGSGKTLHAAQLVEWLMKEKGVEVLSLDYPRYGKHSAYIVEKYLNGDFGGVNDVPPELASLPYSIDRAADKQKILDFFTEHPSGIAITNRFVNSNLAHQGTKIDDPEKRKVFYEHIRQLEFEDLGVPKPVLNITLLTPASIAQANVDKKAASMRTYTDAKRDIHEASADHLTKAAQNYRELCEIYPDENAPVEGTNNEGKQRPIPDIQSDVRALVNDIIFNQPPLF